MLNKNTLYEPGRAKLIGVTGSFCTGKTTVARYLEELGARLIDADKIVRQLYAKDNGIKRAILKKFGQEVFIRGRINRTKLGQRAFSSKRNLNKLCSIIHPKVIEKIKRDIEKSRKSITVLDAPLLIEANLAGLVDYVIVVRASLKRRLERCKARGFTENDVLVRHPLQMPLREKIKYADFVIDNNRSKQYTRKEVKKIWKELNRLSAMSCEPIAHSAMPTRRCRSH